ncbi:MAG: hypothetical protein IJ816_04015 [Alloprevotella sp.]|nr:hypothetical protein [Alloprevotella sp.]
MKIFNKLLSGALMCVLALGWSACSDETHSGGYVRPVPPGYQGQMSTLTLSGVVRNASGTPIEGVEVNTGGTIVLTNSDGFFTFEEVNDVNGRAVIRFSKEGFFDVVRAMRASEGAVWDIVLCPANESGLSTGRTYSAGTDQALNVGNMRVELPADAYVVEESGTTYNGQVTTEMVYLDPNAEAFSAMMPGGDLAAVRSNGTDAQLVSYGMTAVNMTDESGNKLQIKDGAEATLTFPIPAGMEADAPNSIPLWSFDEQTGLWVEDGAATLDGDHYTGTVHHFSWWNLDWPESRATFKGKVIDTNGAPVAFTRVNIGQVTAQTDHDGGFQCYVPARESFDIYLDLTSQGLNRSDVLVELDNSGERVSQGESVEVGPFDPMTDHEVVFVIAPRPKITGRVVDIEGRPVVAGLKLSTIQNGGEITVSDKDGNFVYYYPYGLTGPFRLVLTTLTQGNQTVSVTLTGADIDVGTIVFGGQSTSSTIVVTPEEGGSPFNLELPALTGEFRVNTLTVNSVSNNVGINFRVSADDYDAESRSFGNGYINYSVGRSNLALKEVSVTGIYFDDLNVHFDLEGWGEYYDAQNGQSIRCTINATNLSASLTLFFQALKDAQPRNIGFPDWTPVLSTAAPFVIQTKISPWGNGGLIFYDNVTGGLNNLKQQAVAAGLQDITSEGYYLSAETAHDLYVYYADKKLCAILSNEDAEPVQYDEWLWQWEWNVSGLAVRVFDNVERDKIQDALNLYESRGSSSSYSITSQRRIRNRK